MAEQPVVHVVDDDAAARDSLAFLLRSERMSVETHDSAAAFLAATQNAPLSCVITDIRMPGMTGIDLLKLLKKDAVAPAVIVITGHGDVRLAVEAMRSGAFDFIEKPFQDQVMLASVHAALDRKRAEEKNDKERHDIHEKLATLSTREREVLDLLVAGLPNKSIAFELDISPRTVEIYRANTMTKMRAGSLSELVRMALTAGILESGSGR